MKLLQSKTITPGWLLMIVIGLLSCNEAPKKTVVDDFDYGMTYTFDIPESGVSLVLPNEYVKTTIEEYKSLLESSELAPEIIENQFMALSNINFSFPNFDLLVDTSTYENLIWIIRKGPHIELNTETSKLAVELFTQRTPRDNKIVQKEELLGQKLVSRRWYKYVQWNVKQEYVHGVRYFTHYLISTNSITFGISFMNKENDDFKEYINRIQKL